MITRIEIDGFKTFQNFAVDLAPFQVIIGANGCGKSNFFDALDLLSKLASSELRTSFKSIRGDINELFTILPGNKSADRMRFAVEMLVEQPVHSENNGSIRQKFWRMRYEIQIDRRTNSDGMEQLFVHSESLVPLSSVGDDWTERYPALASVEYPVETQDDRGFNIVHEEVAAQIILESKNNNNWPPGFDVDGYYRMLKNTIDGVSKPYINYGRDSNTGLTKQSLTGVAHRELSSLRLLRLDTNLLRKFSSYFDASILSPSGENLPATLARMQTQDEHSLKDVSRDILNIVPNFENIEVDRDEGHKRISLYANMRDKRRLSINALSEGTLRILALATLHNDPQLQGTLCFEDPEMGVHPGALKRIVRLLREMSTDLNDPEDLVFPLRQVLVTTHSPELVSHLDVSAGELLYAETVTRMRPEQPAMQVTYMTPVGQEIEGDRGAKPYTLNKVFAYLKNADYQSIRNDLQKVGG